MTYTFYPWENIVPGGLTEYLLHRLCRANRDRTGKLAGYREQDELRRKSVVTRAQQDTAHALFLLDIATTEEQRRSAHLRLNEAQRLEGLNAHWLSKQPIEREPHGRYLQRANAFEMLTREQEARERATRIQAFLDTNERLPRAATSYLAIQRMADPSYCTCRAYTILQIEKCGLRRDYVPGHSHTRPPIDVLWQIRFRQHLIAAYQIPVYCETYWGTSFEMLHARYFDRLDVSDYELLNQAAQYVADRLHVVVNWGGPKSPTQWEVDNDTFTENA